MSSKDYTAFITPEISISQSLHTYSGGLGVIGGGMVGAAYRKAFPLIAVSLLYTEGYYDQEIAHHEEGRSRMSVLYTPHRYDDILEDTKTIVSVRLGGTPVHVKVWRLPSWRFHTSEIIFLDVDIPENDHLSRLNGKRLYPSLASTDNDKDKNDERRIAQSLILGFGAVEALKALGYSVQLYHLNEGHAGFVPFALIQRLLQEKTVERLEVAKDISRKQIVFTTHTPVAAGNPKYDREKVLKLLADDTLAPLVHAATSDGYFDLTASCLLLSTIANGVSKKHGEVSKKMWQSLSGAAPITSVTNGSDPYFWQYEDFKNANSADQLFLVKQKHKRRLLEHIQSTTGKMWSENVLTLVWARRFAGYKRPGLLFSDYEWIVRHLHKNELQVIYAGKPHPDDLAMINEWNNLLRKACELPNLVILKGYELDLSRLLKAGADVWLNNPAAPFEACGTSGQSAAMKGTLNISTPDGWYLEADEMNFFRFGIDYHCLGQDKIDSLQLIDCIDNRVLPLYYSADKNPWYEMALRAKKEAERNWSSDRMLADYITRVYDPARNRKRSSPLSPGL